MAGSEAGRRKWFWIVSLVIVLVAGAAITMISFSTFTGPTTASTGTAGNGQDDPADDGSEQGATAEDPDPTEGDEAGDANEADPEEGEDPTGEGDEDGDKEDDEPDPVPVEIASVEARPISSYLATTANLEAENQAQVLTEFEGLVVEIRVEEGERVGKGDVLALLDEADRRIRLQKAMLKVKIQEANFARAERMFSDKLISREDFDKVQYEFQVARQEQEEAAYVLSRTEIRAPFDGVVSERFIKNGTRVKPNDPMFGLVSYDPLVAKIYLPEKDVQDLRRGDEVMLALNAVDDIRFPGAITLISPVVDPTTGTVKVTIEASEIPAQVRPGSFVTVNIVRETHPDALTVPRQAVIRDLQENYVYVVDGEAATKRMVEIGFEEDGQIEITSGLESGESIVTVGQGGLKDGTKIEVIDA